MPIWHAPAIDRLEQYGHGLHRPECAIGASTGEVFVSDWRGGVAMINRDGSSRTWLAPEAAALRPNGICPLDDGFLVANLGDGGGVWRLDREGHLSPVLTEVDGVRVPPANFVTIDSRGRTWISVSTRREPRTLAWRRDGGDGFVVVVDPRGARIVADGLGYTNEIRPDPSGRFLYVVETFARRLRRFPIAADGALGVGEIVVEFADGDFPDGFQFDDDGGIWVTTLVTNRVLRIVGGRIDVMIEDLNPSFIGAVEHAYAAGEMTRDHLGPIPDTTLQHVTSITFAGADRRTAYLGSLHLPCLYRFRSPVAGRQF